MAVATGVLPSMSLRSRLWTDTCSRLSSNQWARRGETLRGQGPNSHCGATHLMDSHGRKRVHSANRGFLLFKCQNKSSASTCTFALSFYQAFYPLLPSSLSITSLQLCTCYYSFALCTFVCMCKIKGTIRRKWKEKRCRFIIHTLFLYAFIMCHKKLDKWGKKSHTMQTNVTLPKPKSLVQKVKEMKCCIHLLVCLL